MDAREERGLIIAATCRLNRMSDGTWLVPSQTKAGDVAAYRVNLEAKTCTCLDHTEGGFTCKHYYAASIVHKRDVLPDGIPGMKATTFTAFIGYDKPVIGPILDRLAAQTVPAVACLKLPEVSEGRQRIRVPVCLDGNVRRADFLIETFDRRGNRESAGPVRMRLRPDFALQRKQPLGNFGSDHRCTQARELVISRTHLAQQTCPRGPPNPRT